MNDDSQMTAAITKLAFDYGPFLFAIVFALVVPVRAYRDYHDCTDKFQKPSEEQKELIRQSELYFRSTWIAGFVLTAFSVGWWLYFNWDLVHHDDKGYRMTYQGEIRGVTTDDTLGVGIDSPVFLSFNNPPPRYTFLVLSPKPISGPLPVQLLWLSEQETAREKSGYDGTKFITFKFDPRTTEYQFRKTGGAITIQPVPQQ